MFRKDKTRIRKTRNVEVTEQAMREGQEKAERVRAFRKEVSRKASMANKRLDRLEKAGMTSSPAYESFMERRGGERFSIRGKSYREVQTELAEVNRYLDSATSSITGAKKILKEMAKTTGADIEWSDWKTNQKQLSKFFNIASQVEQYLRTAEDRASSIGYQKIWEQINRYIEESKSDVLNSEMTAEQISAEVVKAMEVWDETSTTFKYENDDIGVSIWDTVILDKDR